MDLGDDVLRLIATSDVLVYKLDQLIERSIQRDYQYTCVKVIYRILYLQ